MINRQRALNFITPKIVLAFKHLVSSNEKGEAHVTLEKEIQRCSVVMDKR